MFGARPASGRLYARTVARMRDGEKGVWTVHRHRGAYDSSLVHRLISRVAYGGRKGHRAFLRLLRMWVYPQTFKIGLKIKGFELTDQQWREWIATQGR